MRDPQVRVGDADRERVVAALQMYVADGYLTLDEFEQRSDVAYRAKTRGELAAVTEDLAPAERADAAPVKSGSVPPTQRRGGSPMPVAAIIGLAGVALVMAVLLVVMVTMMMRGGMMGG